MNETTILLSGDPKAKADFLATVEPAIPRQPLFTLPFELTLDRYTREPWSSGKSNSNGDQQQQQLDKEWQSCYLVSTDGRNKLPGFMQYLQGRKKSALTKFESTDALSSGTPSGRAILVVPYDPPPIPAEDLPEGVDKSQVMFVKYLRDENILKKYDPKAKKLEEQKLLQQKMQQQKIMQQKQMQLEQKKAQQQQQRKLPPSGKKGGFLGGLLGAQRRTENNLDMVRSKKSSTVDFDPNAGAAGCINAFRKKISEDLEKFKSDHTAFTTKISIELNALIKSVPVDERDKVPVDVFKFTVYEQVEEVGMDKWIAAKEPSEFMDECVISVYKEGHCPPEILEDMNRGELPDEIKGQTRHLAEAQSKAIERKGKKNDEQMVKQSLKEDNASVSGLNANKRDRRTLEQIQKDMEGGDAKRSRFD